MFSGTSKKSVVAGIDAHISFWKESWSNRKAQVESNHQDLSKVQPRIAKLQMELKKASKGLSLEMGNHEMINGSVYVEPVIKKFIVVNKELWERTSQNESLLSDVMSLFSAVPDPLSILEKAKEDDFEIDKLQSEYAAVKTTLDDYDEEFKMLQNQDYTIKTLREENKQLVANLATKVEEEITKARETYHSEQEEMIMAIKQREADVLQQLKTSKDELDEANTAHQHTQALLLDAEMKSERSEAVEDSQHSMLVEELERVNSENLQLKREKEEFRKQSELAHSAAAIEESTKLEAEISELRSSLEISEQQNADDEQNALKAQTELEHQIELLSQQLSQESLNTESLRTQIEDLPSHEEHEKLKKTLSIIQEVEFNAVDDSLNSTEHDWQTEFTDIESLLLKKSRRLESDLTKMKLELYAKVDEMKEANEVISEKSKVISRQEELIAKLEDDVAGMARHAVEAEDLSSGAATTTDHPTNAAPSLDQMFAESSEDDIPPKAVSIVVEPVSSSSSSTPSPRGSDRHRASAGEKSTLTIVCGQRDRFKKRSRELEQDNQRLRAKVDKSLADVSSMRDDNVKLYHKLKFVENYQKQPISERRRLRASNAFQPESDSVLDDTTAKRYDKIYEENLNPFQQFNRMESQKRYSNLNSAEKITLSTTRFFLRRKGPRTFIFLYAMALHILVFLTLYFHTVSSHC
uniref:Protein CASP-like n=1 Tax=Hirondellea gigas TaxID=1518452 RepID=A0A6A7FZB6_9CRUS